MRRTARHGLYRSRFRLHVMPDWRRPLLRRMRQGRAVAHSGTTARTAARGTAMNDAEAQDKFCYAEGDEGAKYCGDPKSQHCNVLGDSAFWNSAEGQRHLVDCMRDKHLIRHRFVAAAPQPETQVSINQGSGEQKLLPCPFCGGRAYIGKLMGNVRCNTCGAAALVERWNPRS